MNADVLKALRGTPFIKMTGSGNDFVFIRLEDAPMELITLPDVISSICNRHKGIGADGLVVIQSDAEGGRSRIRYFNQDGSKGDLCGNASLCATSFSVFEGGLQPEHLNLDTDAGILSARISDGVPEIDLSAIHDVRPSISFHPELRADEKRAGFVLSGVPHIVIRTDDLDSIDVPGRGLPLRQPTEFFPAGANVNWVSRDSDGRWAYRTYERGVEGETLACGTGAIAVAILLSQWGESGDSTELMTRSGKPVQVRLESRATGQSESLQWFPSLRGEGRIVFRGHIEALI